MASKKASASSPVSARIAAASAGEVSGPVATMTLSQSAGGRPATSPRSIVTSGCASSAAVTAAAKPSRSTASAPPAGTWLASAACMTSEPSRRISSCSSPTALCSRSSERNELEQTSSASRSVWCASVCAQRPHLVQHDRHAGLRDLPGGLRAGEAAADDVDGFCSGHRQKLGVADRAATRPFLLGA